VRSASKRCPGDGELLAYFAGETNESAGKALIDHVFLCRDCRLRFDALRELDTEVAARLANVPETPLDAGEARDLRRMAKNRLRELKSAGRRAQGRAPRFGIRTLAWGAPALMVVLLAGYFLVFQGGGPAPTRTTAGADLRLSAPVGQLSAAPSVFSWERIAGAEYYIYKIIDEDLDVVYSGDGREAVFRLDEAVLEKLTRNRTYLWTVEARNDAGVSIAEAKASFVIR